MPKRERMSNVDAAWLGMDHPTNLMMITGFMLLDKPLDMERFLQTVQERMVDRFPRFKQRIVRGNFPIIANYWEEDRYFDIGNHVFRVALPAPSDQSALQQHVSQMLSVPLDLSRPPWEFQVIENVDGGAALFARIHHAIADGMALLQVMLSLTDNEPFITVPDDDAASDNALDMVATEARSAFSNVQRIGSTLLAEGAAALQSPNEKLGQLTRLGFSGASAVGKLLLLPTDSTSPLRGKLGVRKKAAWSAPISLPDVKAIGRVTGGTVNDVLLTAMSGGIGRYLKNRDSAVDEIRAFVPVNLRPLDKPLKMGNNFGLVILPLPVGVDDALERLTELKRRMDEIKGSPEAIVTFGLLSAIGAAGQSIEDVALDFFGKKGTVVMTNVPGPKEQMFLAGAPVTGLVFWVPQSGRMGLGVSIFSYNDEVIIGVASDEGLCDDPENIIAGFQAEYDEMLALVAAAEAAEMATPDDLTQVKGIGPKIVAALAELNITTFGQLAAITETDQLKSSLREVGIGVTRGIDTWPQQATELMNA